MPEQFRLHVPKPWLGRYTGGNHAQPGAGNIAVAQKVGERDKAIDRGAVNEKGESLENAKKSGR